MLLEKHPETKIQSIRAREIIERIPPKIVWMGTISMLFIFLGIIGVVCFIKIEPSIEAHTVLIIDPSKGISGYIFIPEAFIPKQQDTITSKIVIDGHDFSWGHVILSRKELYLEGENRFWKMPVVVEKNSSTLEKLIDGSMQITGEKQSVFKWIITRNLKTTPDTRR